MTFPTVESATSYLQSKLQSFYDQTWVLKNRLASIARFKQEAQKANNQQALGQLILLQQQTKDLMLEQLRLEEQLRPFAQWFNVRMAPPQLGALPVILAASAVGVAGLLYLHFQKLDNQKRALELVAQGILPPERADAILNAPLFSFSGLAGGLGLPVLVIGAVVAFIVMKRG